MSLFHKTVSDATKYCQEIIDQSPKIGKVNDKLKQKVISIIREHLDHIEKEFRTSEEMLRLTAAYKRSLQTALQRVREHNFEESIRSLKSAHENVLQLEMETRRLFGEQHKFLR